ncbi:anti-sigma factor [Streptomyces sp. 404i]|uniref:anti-sigma factor family protein n=1 Tax=Streptomyces sp. 404i TaxID=2824902 RepID=UPI001B36FF84|nr:zf-HC2 domain-containing protein [Streptomyces sp. 404i]MBQ1108060.1 zf-HC2 domain-containing protein [Streptomyces sp. 404i]
MSDQQWQPFGPRPPGHRTPPGPSRPPYTAGPAHPSGPAYLHGEPFGAEPEGSEHDAAAAYVLGVLDDAQASAFEAHLAGCARCAAHLDEFAGMEPMLAMLSESPAVVPGARPVPHVPERPAPRLLGGLMDEVAHKRHRRTRRSRYLVAAAAALIIGGPVAAFAVTAGDDRGGGPVAADPHPTSPAEDAFFQHMTEKVSATDPTTRVGATVAMEEKTWGTHTVLELKNVKGPQKCKLIAVSRTGEEEVVTSWSVPQWGYGVEGATNPTAKSPLYVHGGAAMDREDIDRFEVRTFDGERLVEIGA